MGEQEQRSLEGAAESYAHWWREAGLHTATDATSHGWRQAPAAPFWQNNASAPQPEARIGAPARAMPAEPVVAHPESMGASTEMPATLPAFLDWLGQDEDQPEAGWDGALLLPPAQTDLKLLLIVEMPAPGASEAGTLLDPGQRRFIAAMLSSLGLNADETGLASMALRRPPGGLLDEETLTRLADRMTHYLGLARPQSAIILGDRTSRALLGPQGAVRGGSLPAINLASGTMPAIALAGLDLLMNRPMAKAKSWQALRLLHGNLN